MSKPSWECDECGKVFQDDPAACDDWGGEEVAVGPDCPECGGYTYPADANGSVSSDE